MNACDKRWYVYCFDVRLSHPVSLRMRQAHAINVGMCTQLKRYDIYADSKTSGETAASTQSC